MKNSINIKVLI